jgi:bacillithiol biosynthesis deacetylase BshB1
VKKINLLAFGAHPDDVELSAGGTLIKYQKLGYTTGIIDLSQGELGTRGDKFSRASESAEATQILNLSVRENLMLPDGFFEINQESLMKIVQSIRKYKPDLVLANAPSDRHPDHGRASDLVARACFLSGLSKISTQDLEPWRPKQVLFYIQDIFLKPDFVIDITETQEQKLKAIAAYKSQFFLPDSDGPQTPISSKSFWDLLTGKAQLMGRYAGFEYGEGFIQSRPSGLNNLMELS